MPSPKYKRILVKLSGEALIGDQSFGISPDMINYLAGEVRSVYDLGVQIALGVGGGNIFRGVAASSYGMDRTSADHIGMLATVINSIALQDALEKRGIQTRVQTAIEMCAVAEPYILRRAVRHLEKGLTILETIAVIAPLMGLLGTVLGMIKVFGVIKEQGIGQAAASSGGISEALITTVTGLFVGIPVLIFFNYFSRKAENFVLDIEKYSIILIQKIHKLSQTTSVTNEDKIQQFSK